MSRRRDFCTTVAGATAGAFVMGRVSLLASHARPARRQVSIGGRRIRVVDVHAHCTVPEVAAVVKGTAFESEAGAGDRGVDLVLNASFLTNADKEAILGGNLITLLRIAAS